MERWLQTSAVLLAVCMAFFFWQPSSVSKDGHGKHDVSLMARLGVHAADAGHPHHGRGGNNPNQHNPAQGQGNNQGGPAGRRRGNPPEDHPVSFEPTADNRPPPQHAVTFGGEQHQNQPPAPVSWASLAAGGSGGQQGNNPPAGRGRGGGEVNLPNPSNVRFGNQEIPPPTNEQIDSAVSFGPAPPTHQQAQPQPQPPNLEHHQENIPDQLQALRQRFRPQLKSYTHFILALNWPPTAQVKIFDDVNEKYQTHKCRHIKEHQDLVDKDGKPLLPNMVYTWWYRGRLVKSIRQFPTEPAFLTENHPRDLVMCPKGYHSGWPPRKLTVHGLWPVGRESDWPQDHSSPAFRKAYPIDEAVLNADVKLTQELRRAMPDLSSETFEDQEILKSQTPWRNEFRDPTKTLNWAYQWYKHGARTVELAREVGASEMNSQQDYFWKIVELYNRYDAAHLIRRGNSEKAGYGRSNSPQDVKASILERIDASKGGKERKVQKSHIMLKCKQLTTDRYNHVVSDLPHAEYKAKRAKGQLQNLMTEEHSLYDADGKAKTDIEANPKLHASDWYLIEIYLCFDMKTWQTRTCTESGIEAADSCTGRAVQIP